MRHVDLTALPDQALLDNLDRARRAMATASRSGRSDVAATCHALADELSAELATRCQTHRFSYATEPTEQGNQYVIPGCERDTTKGPAQIDLF